LYGADFKIESPSVVATKWKSLVARYGETPLSLIGSPFSARNSRRR
jgi:hypothetical protein